MRLLIPGGTQFLGRAIAAHAGATGHDVTCAARGVTGLGAAWRSLHSCGFLESQDVKRWSGPRSLPDYAGFNIRDTQPARPARPSPDLTARKFFEAPP